jgi:hypothetical protein
MMHREWNRGPFESGKISEASRRIFDSFSSFDVEEFYKLKEELSKSEEGETAEDRIKQINKAIGDVQAHIKKSFNARRFKKFFTYIPSLWREKRLSDTFKEGDMCMHILRVFIHDWKERAGHYSVPVTVNGVAILTLDRERSDSWMKLYERLGLRFSESALYQYRDAELRNITLGEKTESSLPGMFSTGEG